MVSLPLSSFLCPISLADYTRCRFAVAYKWLCVDYNNKMEIVNDFQTTPPTVKVGRFLLIPILQHGLFRRFLFVNSYSLKTTVALTKDSAYLSTTK